MKKKVWLVLLTLLCVFAFGGCQNKKLETIVLPGPDYDAPEEVSGTVEGTVTHAGEPLSGVTVTFGNKSATSMRNGKFSVRSAELNDGKVTFSKAGFFDYRVFVRQSDFQDGTATVTAELTKLGMVSGVVKDTWGAQIAGVKVFSGNQETVTAADGSYTLAKILPTDGKIRFTKEGYGEIEVLVRTDWFEDGRLTGLETLLHRTAILRGRILTTGGIGLEGVTITCGSSSAQSDAEGYYLLKEIFAQNKRGYDVEYKKSGYATRIVNIDFVKAGYDKGLDITLLAL